MLTSTALGGEDEDVNWSRRKVWSLPGKYHLEVVVNQTHPQITEDENVQDDVTVAKIRENGGKVDKREEQRIY